MILEDYLKQQIQYLASPESEMPQSIVAFGITPYKFKRLYEDTLKLFNKIKRIHEKNRKREVSEIKLMYARPDIEERNFVQEKYDKLIETYGENYELLEDLIEWRHSALKPIDKRIDSVQYISTPLRKRLDDFEIIDFDVQKFYESRKLMTSLEEEYDLETLVQERQIASSQGYEIPKTEAEIEYEKAWIYNVSCLHAKYVFVHNIFSPKDDVISLEYLFEKYLNPQGSYSTINWGIICFEPNHSFWATNASTSLKELFYTKFKIFDSAKNITPIENRLKDELDRRGIKYNFQYSVQPYILDFFFDINGVQLNVECDGREFHSSSAAIEHDRKRNNFMNSQGIHVLRFTGTEIWSNVEQCVDMIMKALKLP